MLITNVWNDVVWLWDTAHTQSHHGVALLASRWLVGVPPHYVPHVNSTVTIWRVDDDDTGLAVLTAVAQPPAGWPGGSSMWRLRWLDGF
jgi:hypothetical protein